MTLKQREMEVIINCLRKIDCGKCRNYGCRKGEALCEVIADKLSDYREVEIVKCLRKSAA